MKKAIALLVVGTAAVAALFSAQPAALPVDQAKVNAQIDARLHEVLTGFALKRGAGRAGRGGDWTTVRIAGR